MCSAFSTRLILACVAALGTDDERQEQVNQNSLAAACQIHFDPLCRLSWLQQKAKGILSHSDTLAAVTDVADHPHLALFRALRIAAWKQPDVLGHWFPAS